jgi:pantoate--beta-alanine ligase
MQIFLSVKKMQEWAFQAKKHGETIALVPTMGALHAGHLELVRHAEKEADKVIVSIFVNPSQFGPKEDYKVYPRELEKDLRALSQLKVDAVFVPSLEDMYPEGYETWIDLEKLPGHLCGLTRQGHFRGVSTVVLKLFNICLPDAAIFGEKDFQQLLVIKKMVRDLNLAVRIVQHPILREHDGLAMSSRNMYLSEDERKNASVIHRSLDRAQKLYDSGERKSENLIQVINQMIEGAGGKVDYIKVCDLNTLNDLPAVDSDALIAVAAFFGKARLIDNIVLRAKE